jgi:dynein heavy chain
MKIKATSCKEMVKTSELACIKNFTALFDSVMGQYKKGDEEDTEGFKAFIHRIFVFALIWSVGATLREESRRELDLIIRDLDPIFPHANTVFEYYVHPEKKDFSSWDDYLAGYMKPAQGTAFHDIYVPTVDTIRYREVMNHLLRINQHVMFVGNSGVGKTKRIMTALEALPEDKIMTIPINFSAGTTADATQDIIMNGYEERARKWRPKGARAKAIAFVDDFNMPRKEEYGAMPPIELIRQVMDTGFWYNRKKLIPEHMLDLEFIAAMGEPGGGRQELTERIVSNFHLICFTFPSEGVMKRIYETICECKFNGFYEDIRVLIDQLPIATIQVFSQVKQMFLPTPALIHYQFNMRDISKVFQGIFKADKSFYDTKEQMVKLWGHEIQRVFQDRLAQIPGVVED